jgi:formylmethanofuran dehydrogenase subunit D
MTFILLTGRTIVQGSFVERKNLPDYREETSALQMNPVDMLELDLEEGYHVRVRSDSGEVVLKVHPSSALPRGELFVCLGPYANHLVGPETHGTGMPDFKTTKVTIEGSTDPVPTVADLMRRCGGFPYEG